MFRVGDGPDRLPPAVWGRRDETPQALVSCSYSYVAKSPKDQLVASAACFQKWTELKKLHQTEIEEASVKETNSYFSSGVSPVSQLDIASKAWPPWHRIDVELLAKRKENEIN